MRSTSGGRWAIGAWGLAVVLAASLAAGVPAFATQHLMVVDEVLASWQGDTDIQFIELRMTAPAQNLVAGAEIEILDADGDAIRRLTFTLGVPNGAENARILIGTLELGNLAGLTPDFQLPSGLLPRQGGRVCYRVATGSPGITTRVDCVAWGNFSDSNDPYGTPTPVTPDNRSLQRARIVVPPDNAEDFQGVLEPTPQTNLNDRTVLQTECLNDGAIDPGEECDGTNLDDMTCADLGFAGGTLRCVQCHFDVSGCTDCGNGEIDADEECDGANLNGRTCARLGFTSGDLACTQSCTFDTAACEELQIPGNGSKRKNCYLEWNVINPGSPVRNGRPPATQRCVDGDLTCDADLAANGTCTFTVHLCINRDDTRLSPCSPRGVSAFELSVPGPSSEDPVDQANAAALLAAASGLGTATVAEGRVTFDPVVETVDRCSSAAAVQVPVKERPGKSPKKGKRLLKTVTTDGSGRRRDQDKIKLLCIPGS